METQPNPRLHPPLPRGLVSGRESRGAGDAQGVRAAQSGIGGGTVESTRREFIQYDGVA
jgi:hypothetical protein